MSPHDLPPLRIRRPRKCLSVVAGTVALCIGLTGCADDGRSLAEPQDWQTTTLRPPPATSAPPMEEGTTGLALSSTDFEPGGEIPTDLTCLGANQSPNLAWSGVSDQTAELAVSLSDQTNPEEPLLLWLVVGIDPNSDGMATGTLPPGAVETLNDYGQAGWGNPCLENLSEGMQDLQFRIYSLSQPSNIEAGAPGNESWDTIGASAADSASLLMTTAG